MTRQTIIGLAVVCGLLVLALITCRSSLDHQSCLGCRGFRFVHTRSIYGIPFWRSERLQFPSGFPARDHVHDWWRYSLHTSTAISTTFACSPHRFADKSD
jgi:hypothetical protein